MAEGKIKWTEQQQRAIVERGSDVLVTASAGTGKTAVLSGRCVDIISDKSLCPDVLSVLVLTFTNAAAEQMRSRIAKQLKEKIAIEKDNHHLRHQLILLGGADIGTIHSFCKRLITEYFYQLARDPTFRVIESDEQKLLKSEALEATIEWAWQQSHLTQPLEELLRRRDLRTNDGFLSKIIELSNFLDGVIWRKNWYQRASALAEAVNPFTGELGDKQKQIIEEKLNKILEQIRYAQKLYKSESPDGNWSQKWDDDFVKPVSQCIEYIQAGQVDKCAEQIRSFRQLSKRFQYKPRGLDGPAAEVIQSTAKNAKDSFEKLSALAIVNPDYLNKVGAAANHQTKVLIELLRKFDQLYTQAKRTANCMDFADLEHQALKLLASEDSPQDSPLPSQTALALQRKYKYIFVDEYQDINPVQEAILKLLSPGDNVFVVGDVKQSIYAFRGAQPNIFLEHLKSASAKTSNGLRVDLNANFRSAKGILDFVNKIFARIMTDSFARIDYDESARLRPALQEQTVDNTSPIVELHILDEQSKDADSQDSNEDDINSEANAGDMYSSRQRQAAMIGRRIRKLVGAQTGKAEFQIYDKQIDKLRDVEYRDIAILMRSPAKKVNDYIEVLRLAEVPINCELGAGYFEATEIRDLVCLLKVLDNPQRDIELAAVLRSPVCKISDTELAKIKIHNQKTQNSNQLRKNFYDCLIEYCNSGPDAKLTQKLKKVLDQIEQWRTLAQKGGLADLIWRIYCQTKLLCLVLALPSGRQRKANLLKLHDRAIQFEGFASSSGKLSLTRFIEFIEKLQELGQDWAPAEPQAANENAVRIISVHKSKGLEFPVVFLAELDSGFNKKDFQKDCLCDPGNTLGLQIIDRQSNSRLSSLAHQVIAEEKLSTALAEEMRILYVAMTRARERLILSACKKSKSCRTVISSALLLADSAIPDWRLGSCKNALDWVLLGLYDSKTLHKAFGTNLAEKSVADQLFELQLYDQDQLQQLDEFITKAKNGKTKHLGLTKEKTKPKSKSLSQIKESLAWGYQFAEAPFLEAKQSVTQLTHRDDEYVKIDYSRSLDKRPKVVSSTDSTELIDSRSIGTAVHLVISRLDLGKPITEETIEKTKEQLLIEAAITNAMVKHIDAKSIMKFFESETGRAALDSANKVWREWPFTCKKPSTELPTASDEVIIVQGIIDMLIETPKGLLVIDFKTDNISANQLSRRAELYHEQLELYSKAASAILKTEIAGKWLYFLRPGCAVEI